MSYAALPREVREAAEAVLTPMQFDAFRIWCGGGTADLISKWAGISEPVARRRIERARQKVLLELERQGLDVVATLALIERKREEVAA